MRLQAGVTTAPSLETGEMPLREAKVRIRYLPEPTSKSSPQREAATVVFEVGITRLPCDTRDHGHGRRKTAATVPEVGITRPPRDTRDHGHGRRKTAATVPEVGITRPPRDTPDHGDGQRKIAATESEVGVPGLSSAQGKASVLGRLPGGGAETAAGDPAVGGEGGHGG
jgi:hypothetical protein